MTIRRFLSSALGLLLGGTLAVLPAAAQDEPVIQVRDGGTRGVLESIFIPSKSNAPFTLTLATEWVRPLANGGSMTLVNQRHIARDSRGRIYQERWYLVPKGGNAHSTMNVIQIADPDQHTNFNCFTARKTCEIEAYSGTTSKVYEPAMHPTGPMKNGQGSYRLDDLGPGEANAVPTDGYRETATINDKPMVTVREFWFSQDLGINLISRLDSAQIGRQNFLVKELVSAEPDPKLFELPAGYKVVDRRDQEPSE